AAKTPARWRLHRWTTTLGPINREAPVPVDAGCDRHEPATVAQSAVFGRVRDHLVDDQGNRREGLRFKQDIGAVEDHTICTIGQIGARLRLQHAAEGCGTPLVRRYLVMRSRERLDAAADHRREAVDGVRWILALGDDAANKA